MHLNYVSKFHENYRNLLMKSSWKKGTEVDTYAGALIMFKQFKVISFWAFVNDAIDENHKRVKKNPKFKTFIMILQIKNP